VEDGDDHSLYYLRIAAFGSVGSGSLLIKVNWKLRVAPVVPSLFFARARTALHLNVMNNPIFVVKHNLSYTKHRLRSPSPTSHVLSSNPATVGAYSNPVRMGRHKHGK
jgi:hypothetical protein